MIAAAQRDPAAFGPLYERHVDRIYRYLYRRVGSHADAEDLTAQTFQQALAALPGYQYRGIPFEVWLYRIAGHLITDWRRKGARELSGEGVQLLIEQQTDPAPDTAKLALRELESAQLVAALRRLPPPQQQAIVLRFARGLSNREVGERIGRSEGAVKQLVHRGLLTLRGILAADA